MDGAGGAAGGSYESIATATGTGSSGTISFTSIPTTYKHLQIRGIMRSSTTATTTNSYIQVNSVTGSSYAWHYLRGDGSVADAAGGATQTFMFGGNATANTSSANTMATMIADVTDYASTTINKTLRIFSGHDQNGSGEVWINSGLFNSTSAISSIQINAQVGNWTTSTVFSLYGIKG